MSLIINAIISTVKAIVVETPNMIKGWVKRVSDFLESDGAHDRRIREFNRRELKQQRRELRMDRRHGAPKVKALHPNQMSRAWGVEEWAAREMVALDMVVSAVKNDGDWRLAFKAYVANG